MAADALVHCVSCIASAAMVFDYITILANLGFREGMMLLACDISV